MLNYFFSTDDGISTSWCKIGQEDRHCIPEDVCFYVSKHLRIHGHWLRNTDIWRDWAKLQNNLMSPTTSPPEGFTQVTGGSASMKPQPAGKAGDHFWHLFQGIPQDIIPVAFEKYTKGSDDPVAIKDGVLALIGDVTFGVPSVIVSRNHRGESQKLYRRVMKMHLLGPLTCILPRIDRCGKLL